jgi:hypothetical protein
MTQDEILLYGMLKDERLNHLRTIEVLRKCQAELEALRAEHNTDEEIVIEQEAFQG